MTLARDGPMLGATTEALDVRRAIAAKRVVALRLTAAVVAVGAGFVVSATPLLVAGAFVAAFSVASFLLAFNQPRWVFVVVLFLVVGYVPDVASLHHLNGLPLTGALLVGMIVPLCIRYAVRKERLDVPAAELGLVLALALTMAVSTFLSTDASAGDERLLFFGKDVPFMILMLVLIDRTQWLRRAAWAVVLAAGGLAALADYQQLTGQYTAWFGGFAQVELERGLNRSGGPFSSDYFGWVLVVPTVLALYLALSARSQLARIAGWSLFAVTLLGLLFSFARASLIAIVAALLLVCVLRRVHPILVGAMLTLAVGGMMLFLPGTAKERIAHAVAPVTDGVAASPDASVRGRVSENLAAVHMFLDHPGLGVGPGNYPLLYTEYSQTIGLDDRSEGRHPHSFYLEAFAETGLVGGLLIVALIGKALRGAWRARQTFSGRDALLAEGVFVAFVGFLVNGVFLHPSAYSRYLWLALGFALVCGRLADKGSVRART